MYKKSVLANHSKHKNTVSQSELQAKTSKNKQTVLSARKKFTLCKARENTKPAVQCKRSCQTSHRFAHWLKEDNVNSDWLKPLASTFKPIRELEKTEPQQAQLM